MREYTIHDLKTASAIAQRAHEGQKYGKRPYFSYHVKGVYKMCQSLFRESFVDIRVGLVALLHDVLEDAENPDKVAEEIRSKLGEEVLELVDMISRKGSESYHTYMARISEAPLEVSMVKYADSYFNLVSCIKEHNFVFAEKYMRNLKNLKAQVEAVLK